MASASSLNAFLQSAEAVGPRFVIYEGLQEALDTMEGLCGNEGQTAIYERHVVPAFREQGKEVMTGTDYEWTPIIIDDYMDAVGEIIEEGNSIMEQAAEEATEIEEEMEAAQAAVFIATRGAVGSFGDIFSVLFD